MNDQMQVIRTQQSILSVETKPERVQFMMRPAVSSDQAFILATWKNRMRKVGLNAYLTNSVYFAGEAVRMNEILSRAQVTCIHSPEHLDHLYGYVIHQRMGEAFVIHFAYVKQVYQRMGIMTLALQQIHPAFGREEVAITAFVPELIKHRTRYHLNFNPYL